MAKLCQCTATGAISAAERLDKAIEYGVQLTAFLAVLVTAVILITVAHVPAGALPPITWTVLPIYEIWLRYTVAPLQGSLHALPPQRATLRPAI